MTDTCPISRESYTVLQAGLRDLKARGHAGWCQGTLFMSQGRGVSFKGTARACAIGCIHLADANKTVHGVSPARFEIARAVDLLGLPRISMVNDGHDRFRGVAGYDGVIGLLEHLVVVCEPIDTPAWLPSLVQGSQHETASA